MSKVLTVKLLVHTEKKRVVLAESDKDFVDILFSFLTLPLGTIIRILGKPRSSSLGSLANLYDSVASLDASHYFETKACKEMLLRPRSAGEEHCEKLAIKIDGTNPRIFYVCHRRCYSPCGKYNYYGSVPNIRCHCGDQMDGVVWSQRGKAGGVESGDEVFVKKGFRFMISDDLNVVPASTAALVSLFDKLGITDGSVLEERTLGFGPQEKANNNHNNVVYAEGGEEMLDLLFSFLTFPLGMVIKLLNKDSGQRCIDNLDKSIENMDSPYIQLGNWKQMLLSPKLAPFFGCSSQLLKIDECVGVSGEDVNPKSPELMTEPGGGYAKRPSELMVTDDFRVLPLSPITTVQMLDEMNIPISGVAEKEIRFGEAKALDLLKAALVSKTVLSDVFSSGKRPIKLPALV